MDIEDPNDITGAMFDYSVSAGADPSSLKITADGKSGGPADDVIVKYNKDGDQRICTTIDNGNNWKCTAQ